MAEPIRLMIVDDHAMVREGLRTLLGDELGIELVAEAADGEQAVSRAVESQPDVVLMDLLLPKIDGIAATRELHRRCPGVGVIILTSTLGSDLRVSEAVEAGALGYLLKDVLKPELLKAVQSAAAGQPYLHPEAQAQLMQRAKASRLPHKDLTARELDVLLLIAQGQSNKRIAGKLELTEGTVKGYVSIVLSKLGVTDRTQAALYAVKHGLVDS